MLFEGITKEVKTCSSMYPRILHKCLICSSPWRASLACVAVVSGFCLADRTSDASG